MVLTVIYHPTIIIIRTQTSFMPLSNKKLFQQPTQVEVPIINDVYARRPVKKVG